jgi:putative inorganic carbon (HCO3(-)) transporter
MRVRLRSNVPSVLGVPADQVAVAAYLLLIPLLAVMTERIGGHDVARVAQLGLGLVCALVLALDAGRHSVRAGATYAALLGLIALLALASTLQSPDRVMAARELAVFAGMIAIALVVARLRDAVLTPSRITSIASAAYVAVVLLIIGMTYLGGQRLNRAELFIGYDSYRFFNHVQSAALPLTILALTVAPHRSWLLWVSWLSAIGGFALLFAVTGRGTLVGIAAGALAIGALFGRASFPILKKLALAATLGLVAFAFLFWLLPVATGVPSGLNETYYRNRVVSDESRFLLWRIAVAYAEQSPWLGIGPMHYAHYLNSKAAHPHNIYLQIAAEWGLPMLLVLLGLGGHALHKMALAIRRCPDSRQRDCGTGLFLASVAIVVDGLFSGNFVMPASQVWIAFTFGWAIAWVASQRGAGQPAPAEGVRPISLGMIAAPLLLASQVWLTWNVWPEIQQLDEHVKQAMARAPNPKTNPRFWSHGWF